MDKIRFNLIKVLSELFHVTLLVPETRNLNDDTINKLRNIVDELVIINVKKNNPSKLREYLSLILLKKPKYAYENHHTQIENKINKLINENHYEFIQFLSDFIANTIQTVKEERTLQKSVQKRIGNFFLERAVKFHFNSIISNNDLILFHSDVDKENVEKTLNKKIRAKTIPITSESFEKAVFSPQHEHSNQIVFVGGLGTYFNYDAAMFLINEIVPLITREIPDLKCLIIGNNPPENILKQSNNNIIITGEVKDLSEYLENSSVYVSPIRFGTGIKTKIIEALSYSIAIVATSKSLSGLWELNDGIKVAETAEEISKETIKILKNKEIRMSMREKAKVLYDNFYAPQKASIYTKSVYNDINFQNKS
jgi:glycosyltransferase involved in cell wall biosynthesis